MPEPNYTVQNRQYISQEESLVMSLGLDAVIAV